jgi:GH43 family beta-xylosidase
MLNKRINLGSIPIGLYEAGEAIPKGSAVVKRDGKIYLPTTQAEADAALGFATLIIEVPEGGDYADHNVIPAGKKVVVYTLVKNNRWGTTEFSGTINAGDGLVIGYEAGDYGKLRVRTAGEVSGSRVVMFECVEKYNAGSVPMIDVDVK